MDIADSRSSAQQPLADGPIWQFFIRNKRMYVRFGQRNVQCVHKRLSFYKMHIEIAL